jgi:molybdopterin molybdotransferase
MSELFNVLTPETAWEKLRSCLSVQPETEQIPTVDALDRVLSTVQRAPHDLPQFHRSTVDGFAVRATDTHGASQSIPAYLTVAGAVAMGREPTVELKTGEAAVVHTGGMVPKGADAVVMVEHTQTVEEKSLEIYRAVAVGENVIQIGEDVGCGEELLPEGHLLRPQDLGGLLALGITDVPVFRRPRVAILSQGDEVVPPDATPDLGQVRDINSYALAALVEQAGGEPLLRWGVLPDRIESLKEAARQALDAADVVVITAGSSVSVQDVTAEVIATLGQPGVLAHGLAIKPGKPTVVAVCGGKPVFGLPGNPVSAIVVFKLIVRPAIAHLLGLEPPRPAIRLARLARNIASQTGRVDYVPVRFREEGDTVWAEPVFGKSNLIYTLVRADGLIRVSLDSNGLSEGDEVEVQLF